MVVGRKGRGLGWRLSMGRMHDYVWIWFPLIFFDFILVCERGVGGRTVDTP